MYATVTEYSKDRWTLAADQALMDGVEARDKGLRGAGKGGDDEEEGA